MPRLDYYDHISSVRRAAARKAGLAKGARFANEPKQCTFRIFKQDRDVVLEYYKLHRDTCHNMSWALHALLQQSVERKEK